MEDPPIQYYIVDRHNGSTSYLLNLCLSACMVYVRVTIRVLIMHFLTSNIDGFTVKCYVDFERYFNDDIECP